MKPRLITSTNLFSYYACLCMVTSNVISFGVFNKSTEQLFANFRNESASVNSMHRFHVVFEPPNAYKILEDDEKIVRFWMRYAHEEDAKKTLESPENFAISITPEDSAVLDIAQNYTMEVTSEMIERNLTLSFSVRGLLVGYSKVFVTIRPTNYVGLPLSADYWQDDHQIQASVLVRPSPLHTVFMSCLAIMVSVNYVNMGSQLDMQTIKEVLRKPLGPIIGFCCQFILMPLGSFLYGYLLLDDVSLRLGLFTLGCSPGGSSSNFWTILFEGDVNLSITMTFLSTIAALGMMPLWLFTLGRTLFRDGLVNVPYLNLLISLVSLTIPLGIGLLVRQFRPKWAKFCGKIIRPFSVVCILFAITFGILTNKYIFSLFTWKMIVAGFAVAWTGYTVGAIAAWACRLDRKQIIAVSIETAFQNASVAFVLLTVSLTQPDASLAGAPIVAQLILTSWPLWFVLAGWKISKCVANRKKSNSTSDDVQTADNQCESEIEKKKVDQGAIKMDCVASAFKETANIQYGIPNPTHPARANFVLKSSARYCYDGPCRDSSHEDAFN